MSRFPIKTIFGIEAREKLQKGINIVADAVGSTLGPKSKNVAINEASGAPRIIHDGVSVAKAIDLFDEFEDMGAQLVKEAAIKTNTVAGDGTTTATILSQALVNKGLEVIASGKNPMTLKDEVEEALKLSIKELKKLSKDIQNDKDVERVATISSADPKIGKLVAEAIKKTGKDGVIRVEQGKGLETEVEYKQGMEFDRGYYSPYFVTNNETVEAVIENPYILITDLKINHNHELVPFVEMLFKNKVKDFVIIGEVQEEALATLVVNKLKGAVNVVAVQAPAFGGRRIDELEDIAILTGGKVISADEGRGLDSVQLEELGRASLVIADRDKTIIQGGSGTKAAIQARVNELKKQMEVANTMYDKDIKRERMAKLSNGMAIINVGAVNEVELADKKERVIDAVSAAKASMDEGIVAGGQITLLTISQMEIWPDTVGAKIFREAIKQPFKVLMSNTGYAPEEAMVKISPIKYPIAIDVMDGKVKDMVEAGVIDPTKVTRSALENAVSVAGMAFTTNTLISEPYEKEKK